MLKLKPIEFLLRGIPESFLFILAIYVFSKTKINKKIYIISSLLYAIATYIIRLLPINYGVHTILSLLFLGFLIIYYNKIDSIKALSSTIIIYLIQILTEGVNVVVLNIMNVNIEKLVDNPFTKTILGIPSLLLSYLIVFIFYYINRKKEENNGRVYSKKNSL